MSIIISRPKAILIYVLVALFLFFEMAVQVSPGIMTVQLMQDLNLNAFQLGSMSGFYFYTYTLMQIPAGLLFDQFKVRAMIILPLLICSLGALLFGQSHGMALASFARLLMGFGSAFAFIAVLVVISDLFEKKHFGLLVGITQMLAALGAIGGELPLNKLMQIIGWRHTMDILALIGTVLAMLILCFVRYDKLVIFVKNPAQNLWTHLKQVSAKPQNWLIAAYACLLWAPMTAFASLWGAPYLCTVYHLSNTTATFLVSMMWLGLAIASPLLGGWSDYLGKRILPLGLASLLGLLSFSLLLYSSLPIPLLVLVIALAGSACAGQALSFALVKEINSPSVKATAIGFNNMAVVISGALFQPLTGKLIQTHWNGVSQAGKPYYLAGDYRFALTAIAIGLVVATLLSFFLIKKAR